MMGFERKVELILLGMLSLMAELDLHAMGKLPDVHYVSELCEILSTVTEMLKEIQNEAKDVEQDAGSQRTD